MDSYETLRDIPDIVICIISYLDIHSVTALATIDKYSYQVFSRDEILEYLLHRHRFPKFSSITQFISHCDKIYNNIQNEMEIMNSAIIAGDIFTLTEKIELTDIKCINLASTAGQLECAQILYQKYQRHAFIRGLLYISMNNACHEGHLEVIKWLQSLRVPYFIGVAINNGQLDVIKHILENSVYSPDRYLEMIEQATSVNQIEIVNFIRKYLK